MSLPAQLLEPVKLWHSPKSILAIDLEIIQGWVPKRSLFGKEQGAGCWSLCLTISGQHRVYHAETSEILAQWSDIART